MKAVSKLSGVMQHSPHAFLDLVGLVELIHGGARIRKDNVTI